MQFLNVLIAGHAILGLFCPVASSPALLASQGKEIIEFYLKELEDEGITRVPRWTPSSLPPPLAKPPSLSSSPAALPVLAITPAVSFQLPSDADGASQEDAAALQPDSLAEIQAGTPEGLFLLKSGSQNL